MILAKSGSPSRTFVPTETYLNATLVAAIAKAWAWQEEYKSGIAAGCYRTLEDFACEKRVDRS